MKVILQRDDERRRKAFIRNLSEKYNNCEIPSKEAVTSLTTNQTSVEYQLQEQVNYYENALAKLHVRSEEISVENTKLHEKMSKSLIVEADSSDEEDDDNDLSLKFSSSRRKERLLRTKAELKPFSHVKSATDIDEPGEFTAPVNYKLIQRGPQNNVLYDMEDLSSASEPGQYIGSVNHNTCYEDINEARKVTFDIGNTSLPGQVGESINAFSHPIETKQTKSAMNGMDEILPVGADLLQPSGIIDHGKFQEEMKRMKDLYETQTKHLEVLLKTGRKRIEENQMEITNLKGELRMYKTPVKEGSVDIHNWKPGILKTSEKKLVQDLLFEREELFEAIKRQQIIVAEGNRHETEAYYHVKKSCELVEQVQLEKQEAVVRVKQLEKDIDGYKEKYQILQKSNQEDVIVMSKKIKQDMDVTVEALNKRVEEQAHSLSVLGNQLEKSIREKTELKCELEKFERHRVLQQSTSTAMLEKSQKEVMEALQRQTLAEHETSQIRLEYKLREKRKHQEVEQLSIEVIELKRRLHVTEENLNKNQNNQLDITNQLNSCKQQLQHEISQKKMMIHAFENERKRFEGDAKQREEDLSKVLQETDKCYQLAKEELTKMLESQTHIVSKYQNECKELNDKVNTEKKQHQHSIAQLTEKCNLFETSLTEAFDQGQKKDVLLDSYKQQTENAEQELKEKKEMVMMLMSKQSAILRDRYLLSKELELLRSQLHTVT